MFKDKRHQVLCSQEKSSNCCKETFKNTFNEIQTWIQIIAQVVGAPLYVLCEFDYQPSGPEDDKQDQGVSMCNQ